MGSAEGTLKVAAARVGLSVNDYLGRVRAGLRYCYRCTDWHPCNEFGKDSSRSDGLARACRASIRVANMETYKPKPRPEPGRRFVEPRADDRRQARRRVNYLIEAGVITPPNALPCTDCCHEWKDGERRHEYDHYRGYAPEHHEEIEAVCTSCHHARGTERRSESGSTPNA